MANEYEPEMLSFIKTELTNSAGAYGSSTYMQQREAMATYLGDKGKTEDGRSSVVSTDVADAIEWILPEIMKALCSSGDVVTFDPINAADVDQAELETKYVSSVLMLQNNGFVKLHQLVKDALLQKNGFAKVYTTTEYDVTKEAYAMLTQRWSMKHYLMTLMLRSQQKRALR